MVPGDPLTFQARTPCHSRSPSSPTRSTRSRPHISAETLQFHHGKHHNAYVVNLNELVEADASLAGKSLEDLIRTTSGGVFNQAAQVWNHTFYWHSMKPERAVGSRPAPSPRPSTSVVRLLRRRSRPSSRPPRVGQFGSGWAWLVNNGGKLEIATTGNAGCPLTDGKKPLLTCDVWEHAYYIDYRNARANYVEAWWKLVNWDHVASKL
jgi:Fe-Mn family superoxide dismutase